MSTGVRKTLFVKNSPEYSAGVKKGKTEMKGFKAPNTGEFFLEIPGYQGPSLLCGIIGSEAYREILTCEDGEYYKVRKGGKTTWIGPDGQELNPREVGTSTNMGEITLFLGKRKVRVLRTKVFPAHPRGYAHLELRCWDCGQTGTRCVHESEIYEPEILCDYCARIGCIHDPEGPDPSPWLRYARSFRAVTFHCGCPESRGGYTTGRVEKSLPCPFGGCRR